MSRNTITNMSAVSAGRLLMLTLNVTSPASSFETTMFVMSGALGSSPVESVNVCEFALAAARFARADVGRTTTVPASSSAIPSFRA